MISHPTYSDVTFHTELWIEITPSQTKFVVHDDDLEDTKCDPERLTFEVLREVAPPSPSRFHIALLPILDDRGVSREAVCGLMRSILEESRDDIIKAMLDRVALRRWINKTNPFLEEFSRDTSVEYHAGMPASIAERAVLLLEASQASLKC